MSDELKPGHRDYLRKGSGEYWERWFRHQVYASPNEPALVHRLALAEVDSLRAELARTRAVVEAATALAKYQEKPSYGVLTCDGCDQGCNCDH